MALLSTRAARRLVRASESPSRLTRPATSRNSSGVRRECLPRPPHTKIPSSAARGLRPRLSAPITEVVTPDECQSIPITLPNAWNQNGSLSRVSNSDGP